MAPRTCAICGTSYAPNSQAQKYCGADFCVSEGSRKRHGQMRKRVRGRVCHGCGAPDRLAMFATKTKCQRCHVLGGLNGVCPCGAPYTMFGNRNGPRICQDCDKGKLARLGTTVCLVSGLASKTHVLPKTAVLVVDGKKRALKKLVEQLKPKKIIVPQLLLSPLSFCRRKARQPLALYGVSAPVWPRDLVFSSSRLLYELYELAHHASSNDKWPVTRTWWADNFRLKLDCKNSIDVAWARLIKKIVSFGLPAYSKHEGFRDGEETHLEMNRRLFVEGVKQFFASVDAVPELIPRTRLKWTPKD